MKHRFIWVDAFTGEKFGGNPCAVVFEAGNLSTQQMQTIAMEMNLSETAFVVPSSKADFGARYFTPAQEIPLAGHPTIATMRALVEEQVIPLGNRPIQVSLELKAGIVEIEIFPDIENVCRIVMAQRKPQFLSIHDREQIASLFQIEESDLLNAVAPQTVSTGTPQLMVPVKNLSVLKKAIMNIEAYRDYKSRSDFFSPHLFCLEGATAVGATFARHFGVPPDTAEDAFTGSATGGMAAYLWRHHLITNPNFIAEQGHWMNRPGSAAVEVVGPANNIETVKVGGKAVILIRGELDL